MPDLDQVLEPRSTRQRAAPPYPLILEGTYALQGGVGYLRLDSASLIGPLVGDEAAINGEPIVVGIAQSGVPYVLFPVAGGGGGTDVDATASAATLAPGSPASVVVTEPTPNLFDFAFGIPRGADGAPGAPGQLAEYTFIFGSGAATSVPQNAYTRVPGGATGGTGIGTCFQANADGTVTILQAGWYYIDVCVNTSSTSPFRGGVYQNATDATPANPIPGLTFMQEWQAGASGGTAHVARLMSLAAGNRLMAGVYNRGAAANFQVLYMGVFRIGSGLKGDKGDTGAAGTPGTPGAAGGQAYTTTIGNGSATSFTVTHNLGTRAVTVSVYRSASPFDEVSADVERTDANTVTIRTLPTVPAAGEYTVIVASAGTPLTVTGIPRVTVLPSSPVDGQEVYFVADAANGILWHLRYNAGSVSPYKWEFVGGSAMVAANEGNAVFSAGTASDSVAAAIPLAGDYEVNWGVTQNHSAGQQTIGVGQTAALADMFVDYTAYLPVARSARLAGLVAGTTLKLWYVTPASATLSVYRRWVSARPIRVG